MALAAPSVQKSEYKIFQKIMDWTSIVLGGLTLLGGCAWLTFGFPPSRLGNAHASMALRSAWRRFVNFRKDKQEAKGIRADNRQKDMNLSKMYVDELTSSSSFAPRPFERARWRSVWRRFNLNIVVPLQQRVQRLESQIERLHDAIEGIDRATCITACNQPH